VKWETITSLEKTGRLPQPGETLPDDDYVIGSHLVTSDEHGRFVDLKAWGAVLGLVDEFDFKSFTFNGDLLDFYELSRYEKDPDVEQCISVDIEAGRRLIEDVRARFKGPIHFNPGNHEERYERYLRGEAKALKHYECLALGSEENLRFEELEVTSHDEKGFILGEEDRVYHGEVVRADPGASAKGEFLAWGTGGTSGHVHRLGVYHANGSRIRSWAESGCLCVLCPEYSKKPVNWQHGLTIGHELASGEVVWELVRIVNGRIIRA